MDRDKLIIFVKNPVAGKVKTRLAKSIGDENALEVYCQLLRHTFKVTKSLSLNKEVWYSRFIPQNDIWNEGSFSKKVQSGETLGERMVGAFQNAFNEEVDKVVIIGSDCAELTSGVIEDAFQELEHSDFVIGPAQDGGYYLLGMRDLHSEIFEDIAWSTSSVLQETLRKMEAAGGSVSILKQLNDVDTVEDWNQIKQSLINEKSS